MVLWVVGILGGAVIIYAPTNWDAISYDIGSFIIPMLAGGAYIIGKRKKE